MAGPIRISVLANAAQAKKEFGSAASSAKAMADKAAKYAAIGVAVVGAAAIKVAKDSIKAASEAEQSMGATQAIYGRFADQVIKKSNEAANAVGLSANSYRESSNLLGALFKNQGVELSKLTGTTDKHLKLAADLSAMYGGDVALAVEALTAAYKGEFNQLEKYGVTLKQDTINTKANAVAKRKYGKELKDLTPKQESLAKQLATQELLFGQTSDAAGSFARESNTLAGKQQRLAARIENVKAKIGEALLPVMVDLADFAGKELVPVIEDFSKYLADNKDEIRAVAQEWGGRFLGALEGVWSVAKPFLDTINKIPGPLKELALQAGLLALVMQKLRFFQLTAAMAAFGTTATDTGKKTDAAAKSVSRFGLAARNAAGIGGMLALTQGMQRGNTASGALLTTLGAVATGFALGGPIGAAVGGLAGAFILLQQNTNKSTEAVERAKAQAEAYKGTLDQVTGAITEQTRASTLKRLEDSGTLATGIQLGLTQRQLINASLGQKAATTALNDALFKAGVIFDDTGKAVVQYDETGRILKNDLVLLSQTVADNTRTTEKNAEKVRENAAATRDYGDKLKGLPKKVSTYIENTGVEASLSGIAKVVKKARELAPNLSRRDIKTIISVSGLDVSVRDVNRFIKNLEAPAEAAKESGTKTGRNLASGTGQGVKNNANLWQQPYAQSLVGGGNAKGSANQGGQSVGQNLARGTAIGIHQGIPWVNAAAIAMALNARRAAEATLGIQSPSKVFKTIGNQTVQGFVLGMQSGADGVSRQLDFITDVVRKSIKGRNEAAREQTVLKGLKDEYDALRRNGRAQDAITDRLSNARQKLADLVKESKDYAANIRAAVVASGDVTGLGRNEDGTVSLTNLVQQLKDRVNAAKRYGSLITDLTKAGLNKTAIQQLIDAGVEGGLATAEALASGGASAVAEVNALQAELATTGAKLGTATASTMYDAGIKAAHGLVKGLEADSKALDAAAKKLALKLAAAVKRALGIKSPSRVFMGIGDNVTKGLVLGLDETYVKRQGAVMAASLEKGFSQPALSAYMDDRNTSSSGTTVNINVQVAPTANKAEVGREIQSALDAYLRAGGRRAA